MMCDLLIDLLEYSVEIPLHNVGNFYGLFMRFINNYLTPDELDKYYKNTIKSYNKVNMSHTTFYFWKKEVDFLVGMLNNKYKEK